MRFDFKFNITLLPTGIATKIKLPTITKTKYVISIGNIKNRIKNNFYYLALMILSDDELWMRRCFDIALRGIPHAFPNPLVGSVIVHQERLLGEGYHQVYGQPHAEVNAIHSVAPQDRHLLSESTLYVNLEPCAHQGKTGPCADLIIHHKLKRVVIACTDPYHKVSGQGIARMRAAGIEVVVDVERDRGMEINRRFMHNIATQQPYIILKWAMTNDGYYAPSDRTQKWISNDYARMLVHKWRSEESAILCGTNTVIADDPSLTTRYWQGNNPKRIILDLHSKLHNGYKVFDQQAETIVITKNKNHFHNNKIVVDDGCTLSEMLMLLYQEKCIGSILVEGGQAVHQSFIDAGLWQEARIIKSSENWRSGLPAPVLEGNLISEYTADDNRLYIYRQV